MQNLMRFFQRIATYAEIVICGHIVNWPWRSSAVRRRVRGEVTRRAVCRYLKYYTPAISAVEQQPQPIECEPECIFTIWLQGERNAPAIVKACLRSLRRNCVQEVVVLDESNLFEWIELPDYVVEKWRSGAMRPAHFADICRVELLYRYGGVWLDSTAFVTAPVPQWIMDEDFFIYMGGERLHGSYAFVQNCFFRARRGSHILRVWREAILEYWRQETGAIDYFVHQLLFKMSVENNAVAAELFARMPRRVQDPTHELWFGHRDEPFDEQLFRTLTADSFFQKTEYKSHSAQHPTAGSFADVMINMYL